MGIVTGKKFQFGHIFEPSGAAQLTDGRVIIVEDERRNPLSIIKFDATGGETSTHLSEKSFIRSLFKQTLLGKIEDIEAVTIDGDFLYVVTSQSADTNGNREAARECLAQFTVQDNVIKHAKLVGKVRHSILDHYPTVKKHHKKQNLNIEAMAFDPIDQHLLLGLRSPVIENDTVLLAVTNPIDAFLQGSDFEFTKEPVRLNLAKGGLRSMAYVEHYNGYLMVSRREDKKGKAFKLWLWNPRNDTNPRRVRINVNLDLKSVEGICPVVISNTPLLLLVYDDGDRDSQQGGHYAFLSYEQLEVSN